MNRREFLKLLGAAPVLPLGLRVRGEELVYSYYYAERDRQRRIVSSGRIKLYVHLTGPARHINGDFMYEGEYHKYMLPVNPQEFWESIPPVYDPNAPYIPGTALRRLTNPVTLKTVWTLIWDDTNRWAGYDPGGTRRTVKEPALYLEIWDISPYRGSGTYAVSLSLADYIGDARPLPSYTHLTYVGGVPLDGWPVPYGKLYWNVRLWSSGFRFY